MKRKWGYQESSFHPTSIAFGWLFHNGGGWDLDELIVQFLFWDFLFVSDTRMSAEFAEHGF